MAVRQAVLLDPEAKTRVELSGLMAEILWLVAQEDATLRHLFAGELVVTWGSATAAGRSLRGSIRKPLAPRKSAGV